MIMKEELSENRSKMFVINFFFVLTFSLPVPRWAGNNADLSSSSNI